jgi:hypothetical protein
MKNGRQTNYNDTHLDSYWRTNTLICTGTVKQDRKEKKKVQRFAFFKISFADTHLAHLLLPHFIFNGMTKAKEPNFAYVPIRLFIIPLLLQICVFYQSSGQTVKDSTSISKNTVYVELLGNAGIYSINYDRIILEEKRLKISGSIGISYIPPSIRYNHTFIYPAEINFLYGRKNYLELSIGYSLLLNLYKEDIFMVYDIYSYPVLRIGYRFQKPNGGFFFRTGFLLYLVKNGFTIDYSNYSNNKTWIGAGFGYTFKNKNQKK